MKQMFGAAVFSVVLAAGCAHKGFAQGTPLPQATVELWRDAQNVCHTKTTPYFKVKKRSRPNVEWKIIDRTGCTSESVQVEIKFDKGDQDLLPKCTVKRNRSEIKCRLDDAVVGRSKYSVYIGSVQEDPELEIEQF